VGFVAGIVVGVITRRTIVRFGGADADARLALLAIVVGVAGLTGVALWLVVVHPFGRG
jgi:hypothetical protein